MTENYALSQVWITKFAKGSYRRRCGELYFRPIVEGDVPVCSEEA